MASQGGDRGRGRHKKTRSGAFTVARGRGKGLGFNVVVGKKGMTKADAKTEDPSDLAPVPPRSKSQSSVGAQLRRAREKKGMTIADMSERTKITKPILTALENEQYEELPNARIYIRGFVRCVANELALDAEAMAEGYTPGWEAWFQQSQSAEH